MDPQDSPLVGPDTSGCPGWWGREQRAGLAHRMLGSHMLGVLGSSHPEGGTAGPWSRRTLEGSLTWTFHLLWRQVGESAVHLCSRTWESGEHPQEHVFFNVEPNPHKHVTVATHSHCLFWAITKQTQFALFEIEEDVA